MKNSNFSAKKMACAVIALGGLAANPQVQLTVEQIVKAWESPEYRQTLTEEQLRQLPANPAGEVQFQIPSTSDKSIEVAGTQYMGCDTQYMGCDTQYMGCDTQYMGCDTQYMGCSTQFESCSG